MVRGVPNCDSCPLTFEGYCLHPDAPKCPLSGMPAIDTETVPRDEAHALCPLRTRPLTLRFEPSYAASVEV